VIKLCGQMLCKLLLHSYLTCFVNNLVADVRIYFYQYLGI